MRPAPPRRTETLRVDPERPDIDLIARAAAAIRRGGLVAFPTETVYGLGADALSADAVGGIFRAKGRPADNPLIVHVADVAMAERVVTEVPERARRLMDRFWPGPLTLVLTRQPDVPDATTAGLDSVAVRMPDHPVALALLRAADTPIAAPSANRSGAPSPTRAEHVVTDLDGRIDVVLDGGPCRVGVESTVVDARADPVTILRLGAVTEADLRAVVGDVRVHPGARGGGSDEAALSPGMRHRHYAPRARLTVYDGADGVVRLAADAKMAASRGKVVGVVVTEEGAREAGLSGPLVRQVGSRLDPAVYANLLYASLRELDASGVDVILAEGIEPVGLGAAVADRLRRAAQS